MAPLAVWQTYERIEDVKGGEPLSELTVLVAMIRRVVGRDDVLKAYRSTVDRNFQQWVFQKQVGPGRSLVRRR